MNLTPEQQKILDRYHAEAFKIGEDTTRVEHHQVVEPIRAAYAEAGQDPPKDIVVTGGPKSASVLIGYMTVVGTTENEHEFRELLAAREWYLDATPEEMWARLEAVGGKAAFAPKAPYTGHWGNHDIYWVINYEACRAEGWETYSEEDLRRLDIQSQLCRTSGWIWPYSETCIVADRPSEIHWHEDPMGQPVLGNHDGPAVSYRDGWKVYAIEGVIVPDWAIEEPLTVEKIKSQGNEEVVRVLRERYGAAKYLGDTGSKIIDADFEGARKGSAERILVEDEDGDRWLLGTDGSTGRWYTMAVAPGVTTCVEAHQSRTGFDESKIINKS